MFDVILMWCMFISTFQIFEKYSSIEILVITVTLG